MFEGLGKNGTLWTLSHAGHYVFTDFCPALELMEPDVREQIGTSCDPTAPLPMDAAHLVELIAPLVRAVRVDRMYALPRALPLYEAAGCPEAATPDFFAATVGALRQGFAAHGVVIDGLDDLATALGLVGESVG